MVIQAFDPRRRFDQEVNSLPLFLGEYAAPKCHNPIGYDNVWRHHRKPRGALQPLKHRFAQRSVVDTRRWFPVG